MKRQHGLLIMSLLVAVSAHAEQRATPTNKSSPATMMQHNSKEMAPAKMSGQMTAQAGFSTGSVVRSSFTSSIEGREPTDSLEIVNSEQNQLYFFTELRDMSGQTARHRWEHNGNVMAEVEFAVKGPRWRVWSSKSFVPGWTGDWKVSVINGVGDVISEKNFTYETAAAAPSDGSDVPATPTGLSTQ